MGAQHTSHPGENLVSHPTQKCPKVIASQMISDLLNAQEQVVKVDAFVYPVDVHKTCRRLSKKRKGIDGWDSGQPILIELPLISEI